MSKETILTGIRANNDLHIGNYFGGLLPLIDMAKHHADEYDINLFIPDLHSFTTPIDHNQLFDSIMNNARVYTAAGLPLDNNAINLYRQSYIPAHSELTILLNNFTGFGEMSRMTQFKEKSGGFKLGDMAREAFNVSASVSVGLFDYPVLMAADILLYNAKYIPVGDDQTQHLELTRDLAERMNNRFGAVFTVPEPVVKQHEFFGKEQGLRIKDLVNPAKKMSKSDNTGKGVIFLGDDPEAARKKIMSATTDERASVNYNKEHQPGITNLIDILALLRDQPPEAIAAEFRGMERYSEFKTVVADEVVAFLTDFQARLADLDDAAIIAKLESSERAMNEVANATLLRVQKAVGLRK